MSELGSVNLQRNRYNPQDAIVSIEFNDFPIVKDWRNGYLDGGMYINSAAGGCFMRPGIASCRQLPKSNSKTAVFAFDLEIDTRDGFNIEEHSVEIVKAAIDEFVAKCKVGFCYHFTN